MKKPIKTVIALRIASLLAFALTGGLAFGQSAGPTSNAPGTIPTDSPIGTRAGGSGIQLGDGLSVHPYVFLGFGYDDNPTRFNANERGSNTFLLNPGVWLEARRPGSVYKFSYDGYSTQFFTERANDFVDHSFHGSGEFSLAERARLRLGLVSDHLHEGRGATDRALSARPDRYRNEGGNVVFAYGGSGARGRVEVEGGTYRLRYQNNRATTQVADRDTDFGRATGYFRVMPKTSILVEVSQYDINYLVSGSTLDSTEKRYMVGVTWEATAATTGIVKFGRQKKEFTNSARPDFSGSGWDVSVKWAPLTYSTFDFYTARATSESTGLGDFVVSTRSGVAWTHQVNSRLSATASYSYTEDVYRGFNRNDNTDQLGFKGSYRLRNWLSLGADYSYTDRDSSLLQNRYKRNVIMFTLGATM